MAERNPSWSREELILALDLYFRLKPSPASQKHHPEIRRLSGLLNRLASPSGKPDAKRFRNVNGVYMKLCNFLRFDPEYKGRGLVRGGAQERAIWEEFAEDRAHLAELAEAIRKVANSSVALARIEAASEDGDDEALEGRTLYRLHKTMNVAGHLFGGRNSRPPPEESSFVKDAALTFGGSMENAVKASSNAIMPSRCPNYARTARLGWQTWRWCALIATA